MTNVDCLIVKFIRSKLSFGNKVKEGREIMFAIQLLMMIMTTIYMQLNGQNNINA